MEENGLVRIQSKSGTYVTPIDLNTISEVLYLRAYTETEVMIEVAEKASKEDIQAIRDLLKRQDQELENQIPGTLEFADLSFACDNAFHKAIYSLAHKESMLDFIDEAFPSYSRYRYLTNLRGIEDVKSLEKIHERLLDALQKKSPEEIRKVSLEHHLAGLHGIKAVVERHPKYFVQQE